MCNMFNTRKKNIKSPEEKQAQREASQAQKSLKSQKLEQARMLKKNAQKERSEKRTA